MAANAGGIRAGKAYVELSMQDKLTGGLNRSAAKLKAFGGGVAAMGMKIFALGSLAKGALEGMSVVFADMGSEMLDLSQRTGIAVEALSELKFAIDQSGSSMEELEVGIKFMQKSISTGDKTFQKLGINLTDLARLTPDQQFEEIADAIGRIPNAADRTAAALEIFGRSATKLLPLMSAGKAGVKALREEARRLGLTMSTEDAVAAERFGDSLSALWAVLKRSVFVIGSSLAPSLEMLAGLAANVAKKVNDWIGENKALVIALSTVFSVVMGLGIALASFGFAMIGVGTALSTLALLIKAMLSPIVLVVTALGGLTAWFLTSTQAGAAALDWLGGKFNDLKDTALTAWGGIKNAIASGDLALAAKIAGAAINLEWLKAMTLLRSSTQTMVLAIEGFFTDMAKNILLIINGLQREWKLLKLSIEGKAVSPFSILGIAELIAGPLPGVRKFAGLPAPGAISAEEKEVEDEFNKQKNAIIGGAGLVKKEDKEKSDDAIRKAEKDLMDARAELAGAVAEAKAKIAAVAEGQEKPKLPTGSDLSNKFESVSGGFNKSFLAQSVGASKALDRTAKAAEETARNTGKIAMGLPEMAGVFV